MFSSNKKSTDFVFDNTRSGSASQGDVLLQYAVGTLPFGGTGPCKSPRKERAKQEESERKQGDVLTPHRHQSLFTLSLSYLSQPDTQLITERKVSTLSLIYVQESTLHLQGSLVKLSKRPCQRDIHHIRMVLSPSSRCWPGRPCQQRPLILMFQRASLRRLKKTH